jgi:hypothetical protein
MREEIEIFFLKTHSITITVSVSFEKFGRDKYNNIKKNY